MGLNEIRVNVSEGNAQRESKVKNQESFQQI